MKYLSLLIPQTGMAHLRFHFFNQQRQEVHTSWSFLFILGFQKKSHRGGGMGWGGGGGGGEGHFTYFFNKNFFFSRFVTLPLEILEKQCFTPGNSGNLCYTPGKFHIFSLSPLDIVHVHTMPSIHLEIPCLHNPCIFFLE